MARKKSANKRILIGVRLAEALRDLLQGVGNYVKQRQCNWIIQCVDADEFMPLLKPELADGAISIITPSSRGLLRRVHRSGVPAVNLFHDCHPALPSVLSDDEQIGSAAAKYLIGRGFSNFGYLGIKSGWSQARCRGFQKTVVQAGHSCAFSPTNEGTTDYHFMDTAAAARILKRWVATLPKPVAILACSDLVSRALLTACDSAGLRVPEDVAILGVDDRVSICELARVPLSSMKQDFPRLGYEAARQLDRVMSGADLSQPSILVPPVGVAARRSTEVLAFEDEHVSAAMRLIHERAVQGISMKELLRQVPVSRKWIDLRFKTVIGHTPSQEIRMLRLNSVREFLLHTDFTIRQISQRCGFSNVENLIRFFREAEGVPPQQFRERQRT